MEIKVQKITNDAKLPTYGHPGDAGLDFFAVEETSVAPGEIKAVATGIKIAIPEGHVGLFWDKSGLALKHGIKTLGGVIDADYRGEIKIILTNLSKENYNFEKGDKVAQMLIQKIESADIVEANFFDETSRGEGGFGSTGR